MPKRKYGGSHGYSKRAKYVKPAVKKYVKGQLKKRIERKFTNRVFNLSPDTTGTISKFMDTEPAPGTSDIQRIGDRIRLTSLDFRYTLIHSDGTNFTRIILFQWKDDDSNYTPVVNDVILAGGNALVSPIRHDQRKAGMINVLMDRVHSQSDSGSNAAIFRRKFFTRGFGREVQFINGTQKGVNNIYMLTISDSGAAPHPTLDAFMRLNYTDS